MMTIDRFTELAQLCASELPERFFDRLNGGVAVLEQRKRHPRGADRRDGLYILGEYWSDPAMGRVIYLYYGSFMAVHGHESEEVLTQRLRETLRHEFRHHLEGLAGDRSLEREDQRQIEAWAQEQGPDEGRAQAYRCGFEEGKAHGR